PTRHALCRGAGVVLVECRWGCSAAWARGTTDVGSRINQQEWNGVAAAVYASRGDTGAGPDRLCGPLLPADLRGVRVLAAASLLLPAEARPDGDGLRPGHLLRSRPARGADHRGAGRHARRLPAVSSYA